jgi:hypothetical protein
VKSPRQQLEIKVRELVKHANEELKELVERPSNTQSRTAVFACAEAMGALKVYHSVLAALPKNQFNLKPIYDDFLVMREYLSAIYPEHKSELDQMKELLEAA